MIDKLWSVINNKFYFFALLFLIISSSLLEIIFLREITTLLTNGLSYSVESLFLLLIFFVILKCLFNFYSPIFSEMCGVDLSKKIFKDYVETDLSNSDKLKLSNISAIVNVKTERISVLIFNILNVASTFIQGLILFLYILYLLPSDFYLPILSMVITFFFPLLYLLSFVRKKGRIVNVGVDNFFSKFKKITDNIKFIKINKITKESCKEYEESLKEARLTQAKIQFASSTPKVFFDLFLFSFVLIIFIFNGGVINEQYILIIMLLVRLVPNLQIVLSSLTIFNSALPMLNEISRIPVFEKLDNKPELNTKVFKVIDLNYKVNGKQIFKNLNIEFNEGINLVSGKSGSGKSQLLNIISGLNCNYDGVVKLPSDSLSYIDQNSNVFEGSIRQNILFGRDINLNHFKDIYFLLEFNDLFESYESFLDYKISSQLDNLSGGQVQRIIIFRSLISNPKILIIDEAMSGLQIGLSLKILRHLNDVVPFIIYVSHREYNLEINVNKINLS